MPYNWRGPCNNVTEQRKHILSQKSNFSHGWIWSVCALGTFGTLPDNILTFVLYSIKFQFHCFSTWHFQYFWYFAKEHFQFCTLLNQISVFCFSPWHFQYFWYFCALQNTTLNFVHYYILNFNFFYKFLNLALSVLLYFAIYKFNFCTLINQVSDWLFVDLALSVLLYFAK